MPIEASERPCPLSYANRCNAGRGMQLGNLIVFPDPADERVESLLDVGGIFGGCFHEVCAPEVLGQVTTLCVID